MIIFNNILCCVGRGEVVEEDEEGFGDAVEGSGGGARRPGRSGIRGGMLEKGEGGARYRFGLNLF